MALRPIRAGMMRHVITIQTPQITRTAQGGFQPLSFVNTIEDVRAYIAPKSGNEAIFSDLVRAQMSHLLMIRAQSTTIAPNQRIVFGTRVFNILAARLIDEIKHEVAIAAEELLDVATSTGGSVNVPEGYEIYQTDEIDFLSTQDVTISIPAGKRFYTDIFEAVCTQLTGVIVTQPKVRLGIGGNLGKYRDSVTSVLTAVNKRQSYNSLSANDGETNIHLGVSVAATGPTVYKGILTAVGKLIG